ncbi:H-type small acid-soluble spore protein [Bacillus pinisoli]|uniref:H-type small acid-soluble spore protein n=1 Tax=Bacillus pinisoli TaxID=2901866 RepID=UPI001FF5CF35|nr:H-type small acid-soluble spore protein [Bacillus pinisoli]
MDAKRTQEIASSPEMINVTYNGEKVYIEHVDQDQGKATVHPLNNPDKKISVSVTSLEEN